MGIQIWPITDPRGGVGGGGVVPAILGIKIKNLAKLGIKKKSHLAEGEKKKLGIRVHYEEETV